MRCSSCEPLLDRYREGTLTRRQMIEIGKHLRGCEGCRALLEELRMVDGLLETRSVPELPENFTFAVMAEARATHPPRDRHLPFWIFLALYSSAAWVSAIAGLLLSGRSPLVLFTWIDAGLTRLANAAATASAAAAHGLGHTVPPLVSLGVGALVVDLALAAVAALLFFVVPRVFARQEVRS